MPSHTLNSTRLSAKRALGPIEPGKLAPKSPYPSSRTNGGRSLPPYYLVYFLLSKLLGFPDLGRQEKVAWSIPIEYKGKIFLIEHRKMGLGIFAVDLAKDEVEAAEIALLIKKAVRAAEPYFEKLAEEAIQRSELNVLNRGKSLFDRYVYLRDLYQEKNAEAEKRREERHETKTQIPGGGLSFLVHRPYFQLKKEAGWIALSAIDAFFSWTEHAFIHLALLLGKVRTGDETAELIGADWGEKFKRSLDIGDPETKAHFDALIEIRRQVRNYIAHGSFGKKGEAFEFHSEAGAVPVLLPHQRGKGKFSLSRGLSFEDDTAIAAIEAFIVHLWSGSREPARIHIQDEGLPTILTMVENGTYASAMSSVEAMTQYAEYINHQIDTAMDMDW